MVAGNGKFYATNVNLLPSPQIHVKGQHYPAPRLVHQLVHNIQHPKTHQIRRTKAVCVTRRCASPLHHHVYVKPDLRHSLFDDIADLADILAGKYESGLGIESLAELRDRIAPEFTIDDYVQALRRKPVLPEWRRLLSNAQ